MTDKRCCRWGIMSTAQIAKKNWQAIKLAGNGIVAAVASRSLEKAESFIESCQQTVPFDNRPRAFESYDALIDDSEIDAVYVPLPTAMRKDLVIRSARAGKHVLCEKPCAVSASDLDEMIAACAENNAQFSFLAPDDFRTGNIRTDSRMEPYGCPGDLGWYTARLAIWVMKGQVPVSVSARMLSSLKRADSPSVVPMEFSADLQFAGGISATFYNSFETWHRQWASISGTKGHIHLRDFVLPFANSENETPAISFRVTKSEFAENGCNFKMHENAVDENIEEHADSLDSAQEVNLFRRFGDIVNSGKIEPAWPEWSCKTQRVLDACWESAQNDGARESQSGR